MKIGKKKIITKSMRNDMEYFEREMSDHELLELALKAAAVVGKGMK